MKKVIYLSVFIINVLSLTYFAINQGDKSLGIQLAIAEDPIEEKFYMGSDGTSCTCSDNSQGYEVNCSSENDNTKECNFTGTICYKDNENGKGESCE